MNTDLTLIGIQSQCSEQVISHLEASSLTFATGGLGGLGRHLAALALAHLTALTLAHFTTLTLSFALSLSWLKQC